MSLPTELWTKVLGYLDVKSLQQLHLSCPRFHDICEQQTEGFWHSKVKEAVPWHETFQAEEESDFWLKTALGYGTNTDAFDTSSLFVAQFKKDTSAGYSEEGLLNPTITWHAEENSVLSLDLRSMDHKILEMPYLGNNASVSHYYAGIDPPSAVYWKTTAFGGGILGLYTEGHVSEMTFPDHRKLIIYRMEYGSKPHELVVLFQSLDSDTDKLFAYFPCFERKEMVFLGVLNHVDRTVEVRLCHGRVLYPSEAGITMAEILCDTEEHSRITTTIIPHQGKMCFSFGRYALVYGNILSTPMTLPVEIFDFDCCYWLIDVVQRRLLKSRDGAKYYMNALGNSGPVILQGTDLFLGLITNERRVFAADLHSHIQLIQRVITKEQIRWWFGADATTE